MMAAGRGKGAVVAETTWQAMEGAQALEVSWDREESPSMDTETLKRRWHGLSEEKGDVERLSSGSDRTLRSVYFVPYQAHATPEPMNSTGVPCPITSKACG